MPATKFTSSNVDAENSSYGSKEYWDQRYEKDSRIGGTGIGTGTGDATTALIYEWYLSFEEFSNLLLPELSSRSSTQSTDIWRTLVTGCGNSTLCEDLHRYGVRNVHGMDYSGPVLQVMEKRAVDLEMAEDIHYFEADCRDMPMVTMGTYGNVIDKGTLDAIASGGAADHDDGKQAKKDDGEVVPGSLDAVLYIIEMWRILPIGGLFAVITTMPPAVFRAIAIDPLTDNNVTDWKECKKKKIRTNEGGHVYFYPLRKTANLPLDIATKIKRKHSGSHVHNQSSMPQPPDRDAVMSGITALLEEATRAREEMQRVQQDVAMKINTQKAALKSLDEAEASRRMLEMKMDNTWKELDTLNKEGVQDEGNVPAVASSLSPGPVTSPPVVSNGSHLAAMSNRDRDRDDSAPLVEPVGVSPSHYPLARVDISFVDLIHKPDGPTASVGDNDTNGDGSGGSSSKHSSSQYTTCGVPESVKNSSGEVVDGEIFVSYSLCRKSGQPTTIDVEWDEDDSLYMVAVPAPGNQHSSSGKQINSCATTSDFSMYTTSEQPYESFEYTEKPRRARAPVSLHSSPPGATADSATMSATDIVWTGYQRLSLPPCSGWYTIVYVRSFTELVRGSRHILQTTKPLAWDEDESTPDGGKMIYVRRRVELGRSVPFSVRIPIQGVPPDVLLSGGRSMRRRGVSRFEDNRYQTSFLHLAEKRSFASSTTKARCEKNLQPSSAPLDLVVEDLQSIRTLVLTATIPASHPIPHNHGQDQDLSTVETKELSRIMAWVHRMPMSLSPHNDNRTDNYESTSTSTNTSNSNLPCIKMVLEADVITCSRTTAFEGNKTPTGQPTQTSTNVRTVYGVITIDDHVVVSSLFNAANNEGLILTGATGEIDQQGRFVCRIPYSTGNGFPTTLKSANQDNSVQSSDVIGKSNLTIQCGFCGASIVASAADGVCPSSTGSSAVTDSNASNTTRQNGPIRCIQPMPSGVFDDLIHDFVCCEDSPVDALTSAEISPPQGTLLLGGITALIHPLDIYRGKESTTSAATVATQLECKLSSTLLDIFFTGQTQTQLPSSSRSNHGDNKVEDAPGRPGLPDIINVDTCLVTCTRCGTYLGDGQLASDLDASTTIPPPPPPTTTTTPPTSTTLTLTDLRDIRLALHCVSFINEHQQHAVDDADALTSTIASMVAVDPHRDLLVHGSPVLSIEQVLSRVLLRVGIMTTSTCFHLCLHHTFYSATAGSGPEHDVFLRIISKNYRVSYPQPSTSTWIDAIKVSFGVSTSTRSTKTFARIPLHLHELMEVKTVLQQRSIYFGPSVVSGEKLSILKI